MNYTIARHSSLKRKTPAREQEFFFHETFVAYLRFFAALRFFVAFFAVFFTAFFAVFFTAFRFFFAAMVVED
ncbi:MAG TPA: hypothetical protein VMV38_01870 [Candidatus Paceibacterota bacterium]|nr:hypothetical protein [Candidatus Paceibacterota bacterium]